ncbi:hypothetical protein GZ77_06875 [Endozoicomonas montiporae]|uniref:FAD-binding oxidoreductase n=2 Tax=Endozoicomonas montiporae TaxID=1027273 RepID=A0A081N6U0_9GAMM|nr:hypothetical protein [Endozoicomonas montiporae]AMO56504.1 hypothetical protein EZMO1_2409 [Endozoicomonas montiporae CL-33]KEQ14163.1 hypothetical protein GZ77_06875 [Endozoicomonas montiporae]
MNNKLQCLIRLLLLFCLLNSHQAVAGDLEPFTSDGCSWFPDGNLRHRTLWLDCCIAHDYAYWKGGTREQRAEADRALKSCVTDLGEPVIGWFMEFGVRMGGTPLLPTSFRWGYGWPYPRQYRALTEEELKQVKEQFRQQSQGYKPK